MSRNINTFRLLIAILFFASLPLTAIAQTGNTAEQEFKAKLEAMSNANKTIVCDFTQTKKVKNIKDVVESRGKFYYDNSGLMALRYSVPQGDLMIMNGDDFTIVASGKTIHANGSSNPMMAQISYMMQACMSGDVSKLGRGWNMEIEKIANGYKVLLKPSDRRVQKYISSMTMCFSEADFTLDLLRIDEASGGYTEYIFKEKTINEPIDPSYFMAE